MKWEYRQLRIATGGFLGGKYDEATLDAAMNRLGREGWELVVAFDTNQSGGQTRDIVLLFKRPSR
jgi:hypothetical protein